jgi:hypothetical protein
VKRSLLLLLGLLSVAGCDGVSMGAADADGGVPCLQPTVLPEAATGGGAMVRASVEVDLGEVSTGPDPVVLSSVHLRSGGGAPLGPVQTARLSGGTEGLEVAVGGPFAAEGQGLALSPAAGVDLRALASGGRVTLQLELTGGLPAGPSPLTLELCVTKMTPHGRF